MVTFLNRDFMKLFFLRKWTSMLVLWLLSACAAVPGVSIVADLSDLQAIQKRGVYNLSDDELRGMEERELPESIGIGYDIGLVRRSIIQMARGNLNGLRATRELALRNGTDEDMVLEVRITAALGERLFLNHRTAQYEFSEIEKKVVELSRKRVTSILANNTARRALLNQLWLAMDTADLASAKRIVSQYLEPGLRNPTVSAEDRLLLKFEIEDYQAAVKESQGDPAGAYNARMAALRVYERDVLRLTHSNTQYKDTFWSQQQQLRMKAGTAALASGRPSLAWEQLQLMKGMPKPAGREFDQASRIATLEQAYFSYVQDFPSALNVGDAHWKRMPFLMKRGASERLGHAAQRAGYLASMGRWHEAEQTLTGQYFTAGSAFGARVDYFVGLRSLVAAMLDASNLKVDEFMAMEPRYAALRGSDLALYYFAAKTIIFQKRAIAGGGAPDLVKAVQGGREMGRTLRLLHASGYGGATTLSPRVLQLAKESYVVAASSGQGHSGVSMDDLLDALQLLQLSEVDRDIAAASARLDSISGLSPTDLRELQDLQQVVRAAQQKVSNLSRSQDIEPKTLQLAANDANQSTDRLDNLLARLQTNAPQLRQAFGGVEALRLRDLQARLPNDESLAIFAPLENATLVMVLTRGSVEQRLIPFDSKLLADLVGRIRHSVTFPVSNLDSLPAFDTDAARRLHQMLLGWVTTQPREVKSLSVIATGPLGALPFGLLVRAESKPVVPTDYRRIPWLIRDSAVSHSPSISSWYVVTSSSLGSHNASFIAWADPDYSGLGGAGSVTTRSVRGMVRSPAAQGRSDVAWNPADSWAFLPRLEETRQEAEVMARTLGGSVERDVMLGSAATRSSVLARSASGDLARRSVVLFATHGLVPAQFAGLHQPALAMAREGNVQAPSLLLLEDVLGLRLNADWLVLSACNTASADRVGGDPLSGLARGFFFAGARSLLVTHWEVESRSATAITTRTIARYVRDGRLTRAQALQQTAIEMIEGQTDKEDWAHPAFWAPYALVGNGRRGSKDR